jgi:ring-1,2-phenylacetyl-CoA epoxidase subunit PaaC
MNHDHLINYLVSLADDEFVLGHRDSEWTGYAPILEEDIAFSNIAQDELGHALALYTLAQDLGSLPPDALAFERKWQDFRCCKFVQYPKGDFAYTVVRQFLFDMAEQVRMSSLTKSSFDGLRNTAAKILAEEAYHRMHTQALVERLGNATEESHRRMQQAVDEAFPQSLGMFEPIEDEETLVAQGIVTASQSLLKEWKEWTTPVLEKASLKPPAAGKPENGGRNGKHTEHLEPLVADLQSVYKLAPGGNW